MPPAAGAIIVVSILVAAGLAAYESDNIRAWVEKTKQKIATSFDTLSNDFKPKRPIPMHVRSNDASMTEEKGDAAAAKREQLRAQIAARARVLEQKSRARRQSKDSAQSSSFDSLVDEDGNLRTDGPPTPRTPTAEATAVEASEWAGELRSRRQAGSSLVDMSDAGRQLPVTQQNVADLEREMRNTFNIPLPERNIQPSSRTSESLLDLTPTTEDFPDPDYSIPSAEALEDRAPRSDYFSPAGSRSSHTVSDAQLEPQHYYAHPSRPQQPLDARSRTLSPATFDQAPSSAPSLAGSTSIIHHSEAELSEDDLLSEPDGVRTPGSAWTGVDSSVSGDDRGLL